MTRVARAGIVVIFAAGAWLVAAPFALRYQPAGAAWTGATRADVVIGTMLEVTALASFIVVLAGGVRQLYADARSDGARSDRAGSDGDGETQRS